MTIDVVLTEAIFRRFTMFNLFRRRRQWRSPALFATILTACAVVCFLMHRVDGAVMLGCVLLLVGLGTPAVYFVSLARSLKTQASANGLTEPKHVYTLELTRDAKGIAVSNETEKTAYRWDQVFHVYRDKEATYLFMNANRAFLLPDNCIPGGADELWKLLSRKVSAERLTDLRK